MWIGFYKKEIALEYEWYWDLISFFFKKKFDTVHVGVFITIYIYKYVNGDVKKDKCCNKASTQWFEIN